jgi:hypothetical protein
MSDHIHRLDQLKESIFIKIDKVTIVHSLRNLVRIKNDFVRQVSTTMLTQILQMPPDGLFAILSAYLEGNLNIH